MTKQGDHVLPITTLDATCKCGADLKINFEAGPARGQDYKHKCGSTTHVNGRITSVREKKKRTGGPALELDGWPGP